MVVDVEDEEEVDEVVGVEDEEEEGLNMEEVVDWPVVSATVKALSPSRNDISARNLSNNDEVYPTGSSFSLQGLVFPKSRPMMALRRR